MIQPDLLFIPTAQLAMVAQADIEGVPAPVVNLVEELIEIVTLTNGQCTLLSVASPDKGQLTSTALLIDGAQVLRYTTQFFAKINRFTCMDEPVLL